MSNEKKKDKKKDYYKEIVISSLILIIVMMIILTSLSQCEECKECKPCTCKNTEWDKVEEAYELMNMFCYDDLEECQEQLRYCEPYAKVEKT